MNPRKNYVKEKLVTPLVGYLKQGWSAEKLALTAALGGALSLCPFVGTTTLLCLVASFIFRLNLPAIQVVNYAVFPIQLVLVIPFVQAGVWLWGADPLPFSEGEIRLLLETSPWELIKRLWDYLLMGVSVWALLLVPVTFLLYRTLLPLFLQVAAKRKHQKNAV